MGAQARVYFCLVSYTSHLPTVTAVRPLFPGSGECTCEVQWQGEACEDCAFGRYGLGCTKVCPGVEQALPLFACSTPRDVKKWKPSSSSQNLACGPTYACMFQRKYRCNPSFKLSFLKGAWECNELCWRHHCQCVLRSWDLP